VIARSTKYVAGFDQPGKSGGDSGPLTALGVFVGLKAAVKHRFGADSTKDLRIAVQGLGKVGMALSERLHKEGARLIVADVNANATKRAAESFGATVGATINDDTVPKLHAKIVAGGANNQLARDEHGAALKARGVLYAPDYVINGGGVIRVAGQIYDWNDADIERRVLAIADTLADIFRRVDREDVPTNVIADRMAEERMARGAGVKAAAE
jgi:leucine dehydrogenase